MSISVAYGAAEDATARHASRIAVLIDRDGIVARVWPNVDARTFPQECLDGLGEPPEEYPDCNPPPMSANMHLWEPPEHKECPNCGFKWTTEVWKRPNCPKCMWGYDGLARDEWMMLAPYGKF